MTNKAVMIGSYCINEMVNFVYGRFCVMFGWGSKFVSCLNSDPRCRVFYFQRDFIISKNRQFIDTGCHYMMFEEVSITSKSLNSHPAAEISAIRNEQLGSLHQPFNQSALRIAYSQWRLPSYNISRIFFPPIFSTAF